MENKKIIVTGGAGFIGSNLAKTLTEMEEVIIIDNLLTGKLENIQDLIEKDNVKFVRGSILDLNLLKNTFKGADYIFHQAAIPSVLRSVKDPSLTNGANVSGTLNVLIAARDCSVKKVVYASSSSVYGDTPTLPKKESMKPNPKSPYAVSKLAGEYYCKVFYEIYGLKTISLRYFNVYGPKQDPTSEYSAVIPKFITRILNGKTPVVYGDGEQSRDFTFVKDVVNANILAAKSNATGVFNIAGGRKISINELANRIMEIVGLELNPIYDKPRSGDIKHSLADISLSKRKIKYMPDYDLDNGLKETIKWFQKQRN